MNENGLGKWETEGGHRREERKVFHQGLVSPLRMGSESIKWPQHVDCYRAVDETVKLITEEKKSMKIKLACLLSWSTDFSVMTGYRFP